MPAIVSLFLTLSGLLFLTDLHQTIGFSAEPIRNAATMECTTAGSSSPHPVLFDMPVSNNGARCRLIMYKKNIVDIAIQAPMELGGLKSPDYLSRNPQGKMPLLSIDGLDIAESDTIARYLLSKYSTQGPSFQIDCPRSNLITRIHDMYITTIQGCLYKANPPFGVFGTRQDAIAELVRQLQVIEDLVVEGGLYICGGDVSLADATLFPTAVFIDYMLPKFGVASPLPPRLRKWFDELSKDDVDFVKVRNEITEALQGWDGKKRWDGILGAGWKDTAPATLFDKIVAGVIPAKVVPQPDSALLAFHDINPAAPAHVLVIPKDRNGLTRITASSPEHTEILGRLMVAAATIARDKSLGFGDGARIVMNDGPDGGQEVMHLHLHVLGGRSMAWPPG